MRNIDTSCQLHIWGSAYKLSLSCVFKMSTIRELRKNSPDFNAKRQSNKFLNGVFRLRSRKKFFQLIKGTPDP